MAAERERARRNAKKRRGRVGSERAQAYGICLRELDARGPEAFRAWLVEKIEALTPKAPEAEAAE